MKARNTARTHTHAQSHKHIFDEQHLNQVLAFLVMLNEAEKQHYSNNAK